MAWVSVNAVRCQTTAGHRRHLGRSFGYAGWWRVLTRRGCISALLRRSPGTDATGGRGLSSIELNWDFVEALEDYVGHPGIATEVPVSASLGTASAVLYGRFRMSS